MMIGSIGVGWLAPASELRRVPLFIWMRTEAIGVALSIVLLAFGGMLLVRASLRLGQRVRVWGAGARKATLQATVAWGLLLMFCVPLFSRDVYAYIGQGRLMVEGFNPYENGISALSNYFQLGADRMWTEAPVRTAAVPVDRTVRGLGHQRASRRQHHAVPDGRTGGHRAVRDLRAQTGRTPRREPEPGPVADGGQPAVPHQLHRQRPQ